MHCFTLHGESKLLKQNAHVTGCHLPKESNGRCACTESVEDRGSAACSAAGWHRVFVRVCSLACQMNTWDGLLHPSCAVETLTY